MSTTGWIGKPVKRVEDARLLTGRGTYIDDHPPVANLHHAAIVRSPHAHARILGYDLGAARAVEGVVGAITGEDVRTLTKPFSVGVTAPVHYYCAAADKVRFVGEPVAVIVAKSRYIAEDAADLVRVHYEPRSEEHTSELQSRLHLVCRLLLEKKKKKQKKLLKRHNRLYST